MADNAFKTRENRVRRMAERQGLSLFRSRTRDPKAKAYGLYAVTQSGGRTEKPAMSPWDGTLLVVLQTKSLDDVEHFLTH